MNEYDDFKEYGKVVSFRLLTEYHSFLSGEIKGIEIQNLCKFPSPYGVSFILIIKKMVIYIKIY